MRPLAGRGRACADGAGVGGGGGARVRAAEAGTGSVWLPCNILAARAREGLRRRRGGRGAGWRAAEAVP